MMRNLLVLSVLILAVVTAQQLPQDVSNGFFEGRSGDLLLKPHLTRDQSLMMFLKAADNQVPVPTEKLALTQSTVSDLLSHLVGTAPLNPQVDRTHFPKKGFFNNPKANLMFVLDSTATAPAATEELLHTVASESYPDETITALTSIMTGTTASKHGIIGDAWLNKENGETVHAFESWCPSRAGSRSATLQDVFGLAYGGRSLVLSFSSKLDFARALSTKPFLLKPTSPNHGFYWNGKAFQSVYSDKTKYTADLKTLLVSLEGTPASVEGAQVVISVDGQQVALDLNEPEVLAFVAEFAYASYLVNLLTVDEELKALVADDIPDFFSFGFATLKDLQNKYGRDSSQMKAVASLVDYALKTIVAKLNALYNGKVLSEAIFLGSNEEAADVNRKQIIEKTKATLVSQLADEEHFEQHYPEVYLSKEVQPEQKEEACSFLQQVLSPADVEVVCLPDPSEFRSIRADAGNSTGDGTVDNEIAIFQIVLWTSVVLILMTLWAAAVMFTIDASKDTMIYRDEIHIKTIQ